MSDLRLAIDRDLGGTDVVSFLKVPSPSPPCASFRVSPSLSAFPSVTTDLPFFFFFFFFSHPDLLASPRGFLHCTRSTSCLLQLSPPKGLLPFSHLRIFFPQAGFHCIPFWRKGTPVSLSFNNLLIFSGTHRATPLVTKPPLRKSAASPCRQIQSHRPGQENLFPLSTVHTLVYTRTSPRKLPSLPFSASLNEIKPSHNPSTTIPST
ncbi:hypothetical protein BDP81DRAFT_59512 [Colletotrichum phormii]|uniref:Uncharacterized protein n=1 Tax=Colletotrichum phormii TaxID=359342 RepID=A0AAJ0ECX8_9PEZI|nr:uncharacterized protein BDP81DRAFT_59512 [Colletotrichum phormii]KAK1634464.1 hypothetical protein BDP81DRAFT_59512 [Colletotrichum phormii]